MQQVESNNGGAGQAGKQKAEKLTIEEKRELITELLANNFPGHIVFYFTISFIEIGLCAMGLQIALLCDDTPLSKVAFGIWGGFFAILNGLIKLYLFRKRTYVSWVCFQTMTIFSALGTSAGLVILGGIAIDKCRTTPTCSPKNLAITIALHVLGHVALLKNIVSIVLINFKLFGGFKKMAKGRLGFIEGYKELAFILKPKKEIVL